MIKMVHSLGNVGMRIAIQYLYQLNMDIIGVYYKLYNIYIYNTWIYFNLGMSWDCPHQITGLRHWKHNYSHLLEALHICCRQGWGR